MNVSPLSAVYEQYRLTDDSRSWRCGYIVP